MKVAQAIEGAILGTAVGDAIGLPREGLSRRRAARFYGDELRHRFLFGRGSNEVAALRRVVPTDVTELPAREVRETDLLRTSGAEGTS